MDGKLSGIGRSERYNNLLKTGLYSDCTVISEDGTEFKCHQIILAAASSVLETLIYSCLSERSGSSVRINIHHDKNVVKLLLDWIYLQNIDYQIEDEVYDLLTAAHFYMIEDLVEFCGELDVIKVQDDIISVFKLAYDFNVNSLKHKCVNYLRDHVEDILTDTASLLAMSQTSIFNILNELKKFNLTSNFKIIQSALEWVKANVNTDNDIRFKLDESQLMPLLKFDKLRELEFNELIKKYNNALNPEEICENYIKIIKLNSYDDENILKTIQPVVIRERNIIVAPEEVTEILYTFVRKNCSNISRFVEISVCTQAQNGLNIYYEEDIEVEVFLGDKLVAQGTFKGRTKYDSCVVVELNSVYEICVKSGDITERRLEIIVKVILNKPGIYNKIKQLVSTEYNKICAYNHGIIQSVTFITSYHTAHDSE